MPPNSGPIQRIEQAVAASSTSVAAASIHPSPRVDIMRSRQQPIASSAAAIQASSQSNGATVLQLLPIGREECQSLLQQKGLSPPFTAGESDHDRRSIILKLSPDVPLDIGKSQLRSDGISSSPSIHHARKFNDGTVAASVSLGRNEFTGIMQTSVSRALCEVTFSCGDSERALRKSNDVKSHPKTTETCTDPPFVAWLSMRKDPSQHFVHIDGIAVSEPIGLKIPLQDGSIISLWGQTGFAYLVKILCDNQDDQEAKPNNHNVNVKCQQDKVTNQSTCQKRRADSPPSPPNSPKKPTPHQDIRRRGHQLMVGEQTCSLCMDILIRSTFAYPCGHAFCAECTDKCCNVCPTCRGHVQGWMPARSFDTIIWATALQGCLDPEDAKFYLQRRKESGEEEPTIHEKECILGKAAQKENGGENGYYLPSLSPCYPTPLISTTLMPPLFSGPMNPDFHSCPTSWTMNSGSYLPNSRSGTSAEDAICLDSP